MKSKEIIFSTKAAKADLKFLKADAAKHSRSLLAHTAQILKDYVFSVKK